MYELLKDIYRQAVSCLVPRAALQGFFALGVSALFAVLIGLYVWHSYAVQYDLRESWIYGQEKFRLTDFSYSEMVGYGLEALTAAFFVLISYRTRQFLWLNWTTIFLIIIIDDSMQLHEKFGRLVHTSLDISKNIGEILGFAWLGLFVTGFWLMGLFRTIRVARAQLSPYLVFTIYLGLMIFFGVFVDAFHVFIRHYQIIPGAVFELVEDGGELFLICVCSISALNFYLNPRAEP